MNEITYRNLTPNDIENNKAELTQLIQITLEDNISQKFPESLAVDYVSKMPGYIEDNTAIVIGAFSKEKLVGFIWGYVTRIFDETRVHSYMGAVSPDFRRHHIAQILMEMQFEEAKKREIYIVEAMVTASNKTAYNWHVKTGFVDDRIKMIKVL